MSGELATLIHQRVHDCRSGNNPKVITRVQSGWVVLGDVQFLSGYCLLLADPVVESLNSLNSSQRQTYLYEMSVVGDALLEVTDSYRINYEILGNSEAALHAHIFPRYMNEPEVRRQQPAWSYNWRDAKQFDVQRDQPLMQAIASYISSSGIARSTDLHADLPGQQV